MKIVMIGPYPNPGRAISGGVERVIDTLVLELGKRVDLTLMVPGASEDAERLNHGIRTIYLKRSGGPGVLAYWAADARRLAKAVAGEQPDLVHLHASAGVGRLISGPRILTVHGIAHRDLLVSKRGQGWGVIARQGAALLLKNVEAAARRNIGNVIVINPYVVEALPDIVLMRLFRIPNPIDPRFCEPLKSNGGARNRQLIAVGRIRLLKNTLGIIHIGCNLMKVDSIASLFLCGAIDDNGYENACRKVIKSKGFSERIQMVGNTDTDRLITYLDRSSVLLLASHQECAPMAIAEAHARGVAVVAPASFGIKYMIKPGQNGFFLPDGSVGEQARVVQMALDHDWNREAIALEARASYGHRNVTELTLSAYRAVLAAA